MPPPNMRARAGEKNRNGSFAGFAVRSLFVSGLMASGALTAMSALARIPHEPSDAIVRASFAPSTNNAFFSAEVAAPEAMQPRTLSDDEIRQQAAEARLELAAASAIAEAVTGATDRTATRPDYGFARLFSTILTAKPEELGLATDLLKFGPMRVRQDLVSTIVRAAKETGADPVLLMAIADKESSFATSVGASTSSAVGLFQFVEGTWFTVLRDHGTKHGLAREAALVSGDDALSARERTRILDMRKNPYLAALMAAEMLKKDAADIGGKLGRNLTNEEIYLAHFLGPGDAYKFLSKVDTEPKLVAAKLLPKPARANKPIFYARTGSKSKSLSVAEVHRKIEHSMGLRLDRYRNVTDSIPTATAYR